jgi:hypothetical protein
MVGVINPVVYGGNRRTFLGTLAAHGVGLALGAAGTGALLALLGSVVTSAPVHLMALVVLTGWGSLTELGLVPMPHLQSRWQVPRCWCLLAPWQTGFLFGLGLGPGITTRIATPVFYAVLGGCVALGSVTEAVAVFSAYAAGRWLATLAFTTRPACTLEEVTANLVYAQRWRPATRVATGLFSALCTGIFASSL